MVVQLFFGIPSDSGEHRKNESLNVLHGMRITSELGEIPTDVGLRIGHLLLQQIVFVEKENDGNTTEDDIVDYCVENVSRLLQPIRLSIFE